MTLRDLLAGAGIVRGAGRPTTSRSPRLPTAARASRTGTLFFCVPGFTADGHDFAPDAVQRGAAALVCERPLGLGVPEVVVPSVRAAMAPLAAAFYGDPTARAAGRRRDRHERQDHDRLPRRATCSSAPGIQTGLLGTV